MTMDGDDGLVCPRCQLRTAPVCAHCSTELPSLYDPPKPWSQPTGSSGRQPGTSPAERASFLAGLSAADGDLLSKLGAADDQVALAEADLADAGHALNRAISAAAGGREATDEEPALPGASGVTLEESLRDAQRLASGRSMSEEGRAAFKAMKRAARTWRAATAACETATARRNALLERYNQDWLPDPGSA
jgi:hypothetical protein